MLSPVPSHEGTNRITGAPLSVGSSLSFSIGGSERLSMMDESPGDAIQRHRNELGALNSQAAFLAEVAQIPALADTDDPRWLDPEAWEDVYRRVAAADVIGDRGWRDAVSPVFERAARGDLFDTMQTIRHGPERAFANDIDTFADVLETLATHQRAGTRQWSVRELGILRQLRSLPILVRATSDPSPEVSEEALSSLRMLAQAHPDAVTEISNLRDTP